MREVPIHTDFEGRLAAQAACAAFSSGVDGDAMAVARKCLVDAAGVTRGAAPVAVLADEDGAER